jgi:hypothetical protein
LIDRDRDNAHEEFSPPKLGLMTEKEVKIQIEVSRPSTKASTV